MQVGKAGDIVHSSHLFSEDEKQDLQQLILDGAPYFAYTYKHESLNTKIKPHSHALHRGNMAEKKGFS